MSNEIKLAAPTLPQLEMRIRKISESHAIKFRIYLTDVTINENDSLKAYISKIDVFQTGIAPGPYPSSASYSLSSRDIQNGYADLEISNPQMLFLDDPGTKVTVRYSVTSSTGAKTESPELEFTLIATAAST